MNILEKIIETKKEEVKELKKIYSFSSFSEMPLFDRKCRDIVTPLGSSGISVIAEIKKASPSKGLIQPDFDHNRYAHTYMANGADAISVLTDENYFQGSTVYLEEISEYSNVPLLRKDFIIDPIQVYQSKAIGADFILLISEILEKEEIKDLSSLANELGMQVLLELHSEKQVEKIDLALNKIIGINNRDLETFKVDTGNSVRISKQLPDSVLCIAESGINSGEDVKMLTREGRINGILVGETLMKAEDTGAKLKELKEGYHAR